MMKGVSVIIGAVLVIAISLTAITIVMELGNPASQRLKEITVLQEGKSNMNRIDSAVRDVSIEGDGSTRVLELTVSDGEYAISAENDTIMFKMRSDAQIVGVNESAEESMWEGKLNIFAVPGEVMVVTRYWNGLDISTVNETDLFLGKGFVKLSVQNIGDKIEIYR